MTDRIDVQFILLDEFDDAIELFDTEEALEDYIADNYSDQEDLDELRVLEVNKEYKINLHTETEVELEEV